MGDKIRRRENSLGQTVGTAVPRVAATNEGQEQEGPGEPYPDPERALKVWMDRQGQIL
jgi:hypothetical protein